MEPSHENSVSLCYTPLRLLQLSFHSGYVEVWSWLANPCWNDGNSPNYRKSKLFSQTSLGRDCPPAIAYFGARSTIADFLYSWRTPAGVEPGAGGAGGGAVIRGFQAVGGRLLGDRLRGMWDLSGKHGPWKLLAPVGVSFWESRLCER